MNGGYYICCRRGSALALIAGPFKTYEDADKTGASARKLAVDWQPSVATDGEWNIAFFQWPGEAVKGRFNKELWL